MEYKENPEVDKLIKEKKVEEAIEKLEKEIMLNLLRVHNLFSDVKFSEDKLYEAVCIDYGLDSKGVVIKEMENFIYVSGQTNGLLMWCADCDEIEFPYNERLKQFLFHRKMLIKLYKKELKKYEEK